MSTPTLSHLHQALGISEQIQKLQAELAALLGGSAPPAKASFAPSSAAKKNGGMSAEGRARIVAAQKARWAKVKASVVAPATTSAPKKQKQGAMSSEHRAKLAAAAKKRWAAIKAGKAANPFASKKKGK